MGPKTAFIIGFDSSDNTWKILSEFVDVQDRAKTIMLRKAYESLMTSKNTYAKLQICETIYG